MAWGNMKKENGRVLPGAVVEKWSVSLPSNKDLLVARTEN